MGPQSRYPRYWQSTQLKWKKIIMTDVYEYVNMLQISVFWQLMAQCYLPALGFIPGQFILYLFGIIIIIFVLKTQISDKLSSTLLGIRIYLLLIT